MSTPKEIFDQSLKAMVSLRANGTVEDIYNEKFYNESLHIIQQAMDVDKIKEVLPTIEQLYMVKLSKLNSQKLENHYNEIIENIIGK